MHGLTLKKGFLSDEASGLFFHIVVKVILKFQEMRVTILNSLVKLLNLILQLLNLFRVGLRSHHLTSSVIGLRLSRGKSF